jgi:TetR/AcrR family transcriptional regulator, cholesterol catabolism regulator
MDIKDKIISGSQKMFIKHGIRSITMDMIAEQLGISKRTIYETFKDKDELLKCCIEAATDEQMAIVEKIMTDSVNIIEAMIKVVKHNVTILNSVSPLFFHDIKKYYSKLNEHTIENNDKQSITHIIDLLNRGIQENLFRRAINVEIVAILLSEQFRVLGNHDIFPEEKFSKAEIFENIVINFMRGIATKEGLALIEKYNK